jgi:hydrogenase maturation protease
MKRPVIIGYGNPLREDDGLGWRAADLLAGYLGLEAEVIQRHQLTPELAATVADGAPVLFMDAAVDIEPGTVRCDRVGVEPLDGWSHDLAPSQLLQMTRDLYGSEPTAYLISGGVFQTGLGDQLSPLGRTCAAAMADTAVALLDALSRNVPAP